MNTTATIIPQRTQEKALNTIYTALQNLFTEKFAILDREGVTYFEDLKEESNINDFEEVLQKIDMIDIKIKRIESTINDVCEYVLMNLV